MRRFTFALAAVLLAPASSAAQAAQEGPAPAPAAFQVTPARVEQDLRSRRFTLQVDFRNNETVPMSVSLSVAGLGHDLDGTPSLLPASGAAGALKLDRASVTLPPGAVHKATVTGQLPSSAGGVYAGVVAVLAPRTSDVSGIRVNQRIASLLLLRGPKPWQEAVAVEAVSARPNPAPGQPVHVYAQVRNTGSVHVRPTGRVRVIKDGKVLATVPLRPEVVIPGFARRLGGPWKVPAGLDGPVQLVAELDEPSGGLAGTVSFDHGTLVGPEKPGAGGAGDGGAALDEDTDQGPARLEPPVVAITTLLVLALVLVLLLLWRRRRKEQEE